MCKNGLSISFSCLFAYMLSSRNRVYTRSFSILETNHHLIECYPRGYMCGVLSLCEYVYRWGNAYPSHEAESQASDWRRPIPFVLRAQCYGIMTITTDHNKSNKSKKKISTKRSTTFFYPQHAHTHKKKAHCYLCRGVCCKKAGKKRTAPKPRKLLTRVSTRPSCLHTSRSNAGRQFKVASISDAINFIFSPNLETASVSNAISGCVLCAHTASGWKWQ